MKNIIEIKKFYWDKWAEIKETKIHNSTSWEIMEQITAITNDTIDMIVSNIDASIDGITLIALGGYARKQMAPYSDIDILILHHGKLKNTQEDFINSFITNLWDIGVHPGIQVKDIEELEKAAMEDVVVRTSFVDNRFLSGDKSLYIEFQNILYNRIMTRGKTEFLMQKISEVRKRAKKFRDSIFRLEPNIKEGRGGIRDINSVYWICTILYNTDNLSVLVKNNILSMEDYDRFMIKSEKIFAIRNYLHYFHNRLNNVLNMEAQQHIAKQLGYINTSNILAVELFMKDYYKAARRIMEITNKVINITMTEVILKKTHKKLNISNLGGGFYQYGNRLTLENDRLFEENPEKLLRLFKVSSSLGLKLSDSTIEIIHKNLHLLTPDLIKKTGRDFIKLIGSFPNAYRTTNQLLITGVLLKYIPEFRELICKAQFDMYHHYTVDEHTILALKYIDDLSLPQPPKYQKYQEVLAKIKRKDLLGFAILLHDIGKGQGKNHSVVGAKMTKIIGKRIGLKMDDIDMVANLVEQHLLMSHISQRRDLHDIDVIEHFIKFVDSQCELNLLYLLTYADMNAVGGEAFNQWRNTLLTELYEKALSAIDNEDFTKEFKVVVERKRRKLRERIGNNEELLKLAETIDDDYLYSNKTSHILRHLNMALSINSSNTFKVEAEIVHEFHCIEFTICTYDFLGLFRKLAGAFSAMNFNILGAQINTFNNFAIDTLQVTNKEDNIEKLSEKLNYYIETLTDILFGKIDIRDLVKNSAKSILVKKTPIKINKKIIVDNDVSSTFTVIDVYTEDKPHLLYNLLGIFSELKLNVQKAKISTDVDRVVDSFYITDENGFKIEDEDELIKIKNAIMEIL